MGDDSCADCGAVRMRWMGGHHECLPPPPEYHPYINFMAPLRFED